MQEQAHKAHLISVEVQSPALLGLEAAGPQLFSAPIDFQQTHQRQHQRPPLVPYNFSMFQCLT